MRRYSPATFASGMVATIPLDPFAMRSAFPTSDYYGPSAPSWCQQLTASLSAAAHPGQREGRRRDGSHVHHATARRGRRPAMPLRPRHAYAADLQRGLPAGDINRLESRPPIAPACVHRDPAQIRQVRAGGIHLRSVRALVSLVHLPVPLAEPGPSDGAGPSRRCQGCCPPDPNTSSGQAAPSFTGLLRQAGGGVLSSPRGCLAPRGARCR